MRVGRARLTDLYVEDGRSVVMIGEQVIVLSEIATAILQAVPPEHDVDVDQITASVVHEFGQPEPPASAADLTLEQVHDLAAHRILVLDERVPTRHVPSPPTGDAVAALRGLLGELLGGRSAPPRLVEADGEFAGLLDAAFRHRVVHILDWGHTTLGLPASRAAQVKAASSNDRYHAAARAKEAHRALDTLAAHGVRALLFKGLALASQAYGADWARGVGDLDLLVHPRDVARAREALTDAGWRPRDDLPGPDAAWAWRHMLSVLHEMPLYGRTSSIDLHWHLVPARSTFPAFDTLWSRRMGVRVGGRELQTLGRYDALAHSASHSARDGWRTLRALVDIHMLAADPETWAEVDRPLRRDQRLSLGLACRAFGLPPLVPGAARRAADEAISVERGAFNRQERPEHDAGGPWYPGKLLTTAIASSIQAEAAPSDIARHLWGTAVAVQFARDSPSAWSGVPRALAGRIPNTWRRLR